MMVGTARFATARGIGASSKISVLDREYAVACSLYDVV